MVETPISYETGDFVAHHAARLVWQPWMPAGSAVAVLVSGIVWQVGVGAIALVASSPEAA